MYPLSNTAHRIDKGGLDPNLKVWYDYDSPENELTPYSGSLGEYQRIVDLTGNGHDLIPEPGFSTFRKNQGVFQGAFINTAFFMTMENGGYDGRFNNSTIYLLVYPTRYTSSFVPYALYNRDMGYGFNGSPGLFYVTFNHGTFKYTYLLASQDDNLVYATDSAPNNSLYDGYIAANIWYWNNNYQLWTIKVKSGQRWEFRINGGPPLAPRPNYSGGAADLDVERFSFNCIGTDTTNTSRGFRWNMLDLKVYSTDHDETKYQEVAGELMANRGITPLW